MSKTPVLDRLNKELADLINNHPRKGHGGTPNITDNSKGRAMMKYTDKYEQRIYSKLKAIREQEAVEERKENRILNKEHKFNRTSEELPPVFAEYIKSGLLRGIKQSHRMFYVVLENKADNEFCKISYCPKKNNVFVRNHNAISKENITYINGLLNKIREQI